MGPMVLNPFNRRVGRGFFLRELIIPNIGAIILIIVVRILDVGVAGELIMGGLAALLLWSGNFAAPIARLNDIGINGLWHFGLVAIVFYLTTIGWQSGPAEAAGRFADWSAVLFNNDGRAPEATGRSAQLGGLLAIVEVGFLCLMRGQKGSNAWGSDPREKA